MTKTASEVGAGCLRFIVGVRPKNVKGFLGACVKEKGFVKASVFDTNNQTHGCKVVNANFVNNKLGD